MLNDLDQQLMVLHCCAGPLVVDALRPLTEAPLDTHLMIVEPEQRVGERFRAPAQHPSCAQATPCLDITALLLQSGCIV